MSGARIVVADDDANLCRVLAIALRRRGHTVTTALDGTRAQAAMRQGCDVLITDVRLPDMSGLELLARARSGQPDLVVIVITAYATVRDAVEAMKIGAAEYLTKPLDLEALEMLVERALRFRALTEENRRLRRELAERFAADDVIAASPSMRRILDQIPKIAAADATVLLTGETGTGKELIARALHQHSPRRDGPLVTVNCAAIPETLLESELFGHVRGAFTGAVATRKGKVEQADGGTLFLDEIGDMPHTLQAKLLRLLQQREVEPLGGGGPRKVDVRIVAATNRDLEQDMRSGRFREDLYYRLAVVPIRVPPLRERPEDTEPLALHFLRKHTGGREVAIRPEAAAMLRRYPWPGNVRELENVCERIAIFLENDVVTPADLPRALLAATHPTRSFVFQLPSEGISLEEAEKAIVLEALERCRGNQSRTARFLRIPRHVLVYRLRKFGLTASRRAGR